MLSTLFTFCFLSLLPLLQLSYFFSSFLRFFKQGLKERTIAWHVNKGDFGSPLFLLNTTCQNKHLKVAPTPKENPHR